MIETNLDLQSREEPLNDTEKQEVIENARERLLLWKKRFLVSSRVFLLSCASVYPFLFGHSLHVYWKSFGKYLVLLSMGYFSRLCIVERRFGWLGVGSVICRRIETPLPDTVKKKLSEIPGIIGLTTDKSLIGTLAEIRQSTKTLPLNFYGLGTAKLLLWEYSFCGNSNR